MTKLVQSCITSINVFGTGDNPVFGETVTKVSLDDEAAGLFVVLEQDGYAVRFDFEEFEEVAKAVRFLKRQARKVGND